MADPLIDIPDRAAFKASEVCEIAQIPLYVLRSWEKEFPRLGVASKPGGPRVYRRPDVEQVLRIKQLLFAEGLTLSGARRKLEGEPPPEAEPEPVLPVPEEVRAKVTRVKTELRSLLDLLSDDHVRRDAPRASAGGTSVDEGAATAPSPTTAVAPESLRTWPPRRASEAPGTEGEGREAETVGGGRKAEGTDGGERGAEGGTAAATRPRRSRRVGKEIKEHP